VNDVVWDAICALLPLSYLSVVEADEMVRVPYLYKEPTKGPFVVVWYCTMERGSFVGGGHLMVLDRNTGEVIYVGHDGQE